MVMTLSLVTIIVGVAVTTWGVVLLMRAVLQRAGIVDKPNTRSSHTVPTVRGGGVAIVAVVASAMAWLGLRENHSLSVIGYLVGGLWFLLGAFLLLAVVSFVDDLKGLPARVRFLVQTLCAIIAVVALATNIQQPTTIPTLAFWAVTVVWIAGYTNAFNFMDGINGIAGSQAVVTGLGTALIALRLDVGASDPLVFLSWVVAGAALGFLPHNFPRARVFMGDVSSAPLGFLLAALAFWIASLTSWWVLFWLGLLHANFVLDTGITLLRRAWRRERLSEAHREHFYQRLVRAGASHTQVTLAEAGLQSVVLMAVWWATPSGWVVRGLVGVGVITVWLAFFAYAEMRFRRHQPVRVPTVSAG